MKKERILDKKEKTREPNTGTKFNLSRANSSLRSSNNARLVVVSSSAVKKERNEHIPISYNMLP